MFYMSDKLTTIADLCLICVNYPKIADLTRVCFMYKSIALCIALCIAFLAEWLGPQLTNPVTLGSSPSIKISFLVSLPQPL